MSLFRIGIDTSIAQVKGGLARFTHNDLRSATALTLTRTMRLVEKAELHEMRDIFDRPTPYTMSSLFLRPAKPTQLEAIVGFKDQATKAVPASKFLQPQVSGGARELKRFERALFHAGVLPPGHWLVPGEAARMDAWGNMSRGQIVQILAWFRAFPENGYRANSTPATRARLMRGGRKRHGLAYFVARPGGHLPPGIWMREIHGLTSRPRPVLMFVMRTHYEPIFDFHYVAERTVQRELPGQFRAAMAEARATSRGAR